MMAKRRHTEAVLQALVDDAIDNGDAEPIVKRFTEGLRDKELEWVVQDICSRGSEQVLIKLIFALPERYTEYVLKQMVRRRLWGAVLKCLRCTVRDELRAWAIDEAIQNADDKNLADILKTCCENQAELALETAVARRLWETVVDLMYMVTDQKKAWAANEAVRYADQRTLQSVLVYLTDDQRDFALSETVKRGWISCVNQLLYCVPEAARRQQIAKEACTNASEKDIQSHWLISYSEYHEVVLAEALRRGMWKFIVQCNWNVSSELRIRAILDACERTNANELNSVVSCLSTNLTDEAALNTLILTLLERQHWATVANLFISHRVTDTLRKQILQETSRKASEHDLEFIKQGDISPSEIDIVLPELIQRQLWKLIIQLKLETLTEEQKKRLIVEAVNTADDRSLCCLWFCFILVDQSTADGMMRKIVERQLWSSFSVLFNLHIVGDAVGKWAVEQAVKRVSDIDFHTVAFSCFKLKPKATFTEAVQRRLWTVVSDLMTKGVDREESSWAVTQAAKYADEYHLSVLIRCYCEDGMLEEILREVVSRGLWGVVYDILQRGVSDSGRKVAVEEALKHVDSTQLLNILSYCTDDQLDLVLSDLVKRRLWGSVGDLLKRNVSDSSRRRIIEEASKHASDDQLFHLLQHCAEDQVVSVLEKAVRRHLWRCVDELLKSAKSMAGWTVLEASKHAEEHQFVSFLSLCPDEQLGPVLTELVRRRMWSLVCEMLKRRVTETNKRCAISEGSKHATEIELIALLPVCTDSQLDIVLTEAVNRGLWSAVQKGLCYRLRDDLRQWVVDEANNHAPDDVLCNISRYCCSSEQRETVCRAAVQRCMLKTVQATFYCLSSEQQTLLILEASKSARGSDSKDRWDILASLPFYLLTDTQQTEVIRVASERADESNMKRYLSVCPPRLLDFVLTSAVKRGFWTVVKDLLGDDTSDKVKRWAVEETMRYAGNKEYSSIIRLCGDDQLDIAIDEAISRRLWEDLDFLLDKMVTSSQPGNVINIRIEWTIAETSKCANENYLKLQIQKFCTNRRLSLDSVMDVVVRRRMWSIVALILEEHMVSEETQRQAIEQALKFAEGGVLRTISRHCFDDQLDHAVKTVTERDQFLIVPGLLERDVSKDMQTWVVGVAIERADDTHLNRILTYCPDDQVESVLTKAVERHRWSSLKTLLANPRVTDEKRKCVVVESCRFAPEDVIIDVLLPYCSGEIFDTVLTCMILNCGGHAKALTELIRRADDKQHVQLVVDHAMEQMEQMNPRGVDSLTDFCIYKRHWTILSYVLHHSDNSDSKWTLIIETLFSTRHDPLGADHEFQDCHRIFRHCSAARRMSALEASVRENQSSTACGILSCIEQHGDPLAVTKDNQTILDLALDISDGRRELVAECIKIGATMRNQRRQFFDIILYNSQYICWPRKRKVNDELWGIVRLLYETGSCSIADLRMLRYTVQFEFINHQSGSNDASDNLIRNLDTVISTPRTLKSACRLVISRCLGVGCRRQERVQQLEIPETLKNYLLFSEERAVCSRKVVNNDLIAREDGDDVHNSEDEDDSD